MQSGAEAQKERQDKTRQDIVTLQVQLFGTQLARKRWSRRDKLILLPEIRVLQNLEKLGGGGAHKGWEDRRDMK